jgi:N-sulfoglucosamine sulfohydrolase
MKNILFIVADDLGNNLGCYGEPIVQTPHIDRLAASGIRFDNAFASTASCSGSRSVLYTGLHTHTNGQYGLEHAFHHFMTHDNVETLPGLFNAGGYLTGIVGKIHVGPDTVYPYTVRTESPTRDVQWVAESTNEIFMQAKKLNQPFCVTVGFMDPHRNNTRGGFANDTTYPGVTDIIYDPKDVRVPFYLPDLPAVRQELAEYFRSISRMDQGVGMILRHLEDAGLAQDTMVVFTSDNGSPFINSKTTLYDAGVHLPLIVKCPGGPQGKVDSSMISYVDILPTFLEFAGIQPPVNTRAPKRHGLSFLPLLEPQSSSNTRFRPNEDVYGSHTFHEITNFYPTRFLRSRRYKYHRNICWKLDFPFSMDIYVSLSWEAIRNCAKPKGGDIMIGKRTLTSYVARGPEELYDMDEDPYEVVNLVQDPKHADLVKEMREKVVAWQRLTEDPWLFRDGVTMRGLGRFLDEGMSIPDRFDFELSSPGSFVSTKETGDQSTAGNGIKANGVH